MRRITGASFPSEHTDAVTVNISGGGVCFRHETPIDAGDFLAVEMTLPDFSSQVVALARAAYCAERGGMFDVGIEFWWVGWGDDSAQRAIADYIKTELR